MPPKRATRKADDQSAAPEDSVEESDKDNSPGTQNDDEPSSENAEEEASTVPKRKLSSSNESEVDAKHSRIEEPEVEPEIVVVPATTTSIEKPAAASESSAAAAAPAAESLTSSTTPVAISQDADPSIGLMSISAATTDSDNGVITEVWHISPDKVGAIIGTKGAIIMEIQVRSLCKVLVDQNMPAGQDRVVTLIGSKEQVLAAGNIIKLILAHGPTAIHINTQTGGALLNTMMKCSQPLVGRIIGGGGATIRELQSRSGAKIQINQNFPDGVDREVMITGTEAAIKIASELIQYVLDNGPHLPPVATDQPGGYPGAVGGMNGAMAAALGNGGTMSFEVAKMHVGKIIGRGGEIVTMIQQKSGCAKVQIDQNVPEGAPCKVMITGAPPNQQYAMHLIQEIMTGGAQRIHSLPPIGGMGGMGMGAASMYGPGGMQQGGYGGGGAAAMYGQAQGGYGAGGSYGGAMGGGYGGAMGGYGGGYGGQQGGYGGGAAAMYGGGASAYGGHGGGYGGQPPAAPKPASPWSEHKTDEGHMYWYNASTGVSTWERPADF
jgi:far upstream element-binding protein